MNQNLPTFIPRALIVDDEELGRKNLQCAIDEHSNWSIVAQVSSVAEARNILASEQIDVIFLDIQMPEETGLQLARELSTQEAPPLIIFVTVFNEHAIEAFELHALDYLLKPLNDTRLAKALERAESMLSLQQKADYRKALRRYVEDENSKTQPTQEYWQQVCVRSIGKIETVFLSDVLWIEAQGNYMQLHTDARAILYRAPMTRLVKHLDPKIFMRIHRGTIVRKDQIASIYVAADNYYKMVMRCGDQTQISERYIASVKEALDKQNSSLLATGIWK
ncbi:LytR/AlgR family response regulator transcription factor [Undibacterium flavidum]|uniref:Response regulator transcription factor n=1 Tax=Undibacterium flavidum TaxID=2762297 RepID=A0ABR6YF02_9BURK|nr:LytTR family DNA-binding domain-containing protein [Undibacterium flavidum]MBC3875144.1 response regulator transcription factor [Undibacterium flavidum]